MSSKNENLYLSGKTFQVKAYRNYVKFTFLFEISVIIVSE